MTQPLFLLFLAGLAIAFVLGFLAGKRAGRRQAARELLILDDQSLFGTYYGP